MRKRKRQLKRILSWRSANISSMSYLLVTLRKSSVPPSLNTFKFLFGFISTSLILTQPISDNLRSSRPFSGIKGCVSSSLLCFLSPSKPHQGHTYLSTNLSRSDSIPVSRAKLFSIPQPKPSTRGTRLSIGICAMESKV